MRALFRELLAHAGAHRTIEATQYEASVARFLLEFMEFREERRGGAYVYTDGATTVEVPRWEPPTGGIPSGEAVRIPGRGALPPPGDGR